MEKNLSALSLKQEVLQQEVLQNTDKILCN